MLTTSDIIGELAQLGIEVTIPQLARWVRSGLLPSDCRIQHGMGRARGKEWLWDKKAIPKIVIIALFLRKHRSIFLAREIVKDYFVV